MCCVVYHHDMHTCEQLLQLAICLDVGLFSVLGFAFLC